MALTSTITWAPYPEEKPAVIFEQAQVDSKVPYYVATKGKQVFVLVWHSKQNHFARWEWFSGSIYHGDVLYFALPPSSPAS